MSTGTVLAKTSRAWHAVDVGVNMAAKLKTNAAGLVGCLIIGVEEPAARAASTDDAGLAWYIDNIASCQASHIISSTVEKFTTWNGLTNHRPVFIRRDLNRSVSASSAGNDVSIEPFHAWAQPRYIERRKQAVAVWYSLLNFLIFNWTGYGGEEGGLHQLGLSPSRTCSERIDDLRLYVTLQERLAPPRKVFAGIARNFFSSILEDPNPTPRSNPLLWWMAVLIHSEVHGQHTLLPAFGVEDTLDFSAKLEALDHYARVLTLQATFVRWRDPLGHL
ncbi:uncharacterized protein LTR77_001758 [Saxophila tyrrhenica]|uniref:Uncharacterized protein n=1 Tax=Saxophila tyrrhenica TaxID=1690608 RepID=A0AAV9PLL7_9PEZI|nr:hypothetical protein LTR77_001758 [Saxophila tyrrhenica]